MYGEGFIRPLFKNSLPGFLVLAGIAGVLFLQAHVIKHLPLRDCLPYKKGNDILKLRQMPANAVADKFDYKFIYQKKGEKKSFTADKLPDSTWSYVDRQQVLVQKGKTSWSKIS